MFTFSRLGQHGRFGNQLFQIAATIAMAMKHGVGYMFPRWEYCSLFKIPIPQVDILPRPDFQLYQRAYHFIDLSLRFDKPYVVDLCGTFQSEKFFANCVDTIRMHFEPSVTIVNALRTGYDDVLRRGPSCIMVVRRGDFVTSPELQPPQTAEFYAAAMETFERGTTFFVTSDDIAWCYENVKGPSVIFLPQRSWIHNFFLGTLCDHAIVSNSTFGWWFAYLGQNPNRRVIAAKRWFGPAKADRDTKDLLPSGWIAM